MWTYKYIVYIYTYIHTHLYILYIYTKSPWVLLCLSCSWHLFCFMNVLSSQISLNIIVIVIISDVSRIFWDIYSTVLFFSAAFFLKCLKILIAHLYLRMRKQTAWEACLYVWTTFIHYFLVWWEQVLSSLSGSGPLLNAKWGRLYSCLSQPMLAVLILSRWLFCFLREKFSMFLLKYKGHLCAVVQECKKEICEETNRPPGNTLFSLTSQSCLNTVPGDRPGRSAPSSAVVGQCITYVGTSFSPVHQSTYFHPFHIL